MKLLLADDQALVRAGLRMILETQPGFEVVGEAADGLEAVRLADELRPDVVLMDVRMPRCDGIEATAEIRRLPHSIAVLILTTYDLDAHVYDAFRAGACGFLLKNAPPQELIESVRNATSGDALVSPAITTRLVQQFVERPRPGGDTPAQVRGLTDRERDVLTLIARGLNNTEIASALFLSEATVRTHVGRIFAKAGLRDRVQAVVLAYECGLVTPGAP